MFNKTTIYWSYGNTMQIRAEEPAPLLKTYFRDKNPDDYDYNRCPAFAELNKNTFSLKSVFDYNLSFDAKDIFEVVSTSQNQEFFNNMVNMRSYKSRLASIEQPFIFIAEEDSLEMEVLPSFMENNSFNKTSIFIPGTLDIGKYVRPLDMAFHCRDNIMEIKEGDVYAYIRFKTDKNIEFKRFTWNDEIAEPIDGVVEGIKKYRKFKFKPLSWYYKKQQAMKIKQQTLKAIKKQQ